jgi:hypothetical protein
MADPCLPTMSPAVSRLLVRKSRRATTTCPSGSSVPWSAACGAEPASDLGICTHHLFTIFPEGRSNAS